MSKLLPAVHFVKSLKGTHDEVFTSLLMNSHPAEKKTAEEWHAVIATYKAQPAHPVKK